jgi:hypothetical protein
MVEFASIDGGTSYPTAPVDSTTGQSSDYVTPYKLGTGIQRGTQGVGFSGPKIDSANNRILLTNSADGSQLGIGIIPGATNEFGFFTLDSKGKLIWKSVNGTQSFYNPIDNYNNSIILGFAPTDKRSGLWIGKIGQIVKTLLGG